VSVQVSERVIKGILRGVCVCVSVQIRYRVS